MHADNLSPDEVVAAVSTANAVSPSGNVLMGGQYPVVPVNSVVKNIQDLAALPLRVTGSGAVYLRDVAEISDGTDVITSYALAIVDRPSVHRPPRRGDIDAATNTPRSSRRFPPPPSP